MADSPPPSPMSLYQAQLLVEKAKLASSKARKNKKESTTSASKTTEKEAAAEENGVDEGFNKSDKENGDSSGDGIKYVLCFLYPIGISNVFCSWLKNPGDTTQLLVIIEERIRYRKAFGFKGGDVPGVTSGGSTMAQTSRDIGGTLFPHSTLPADKLGKAVSNRIRTCIISLTLLPYNADFK